LRVTVREAVGTVAFVLVAVVLVAVVLVTVRLGAAASGGAAAVVSGAAVSVVTGVLSVVGGGVDVVGAGSVIAGASWANSGVDESAKAAAIAAAPARAYSLLVFVIMPEQPAKGRSGGTIIVARRLRADERFSVQPFMTWYKKMDVQRGPRRP
jgi:hypothetical protein